MGATIEIRDVPERLHERLLLLSAQTGQALSDHLLGELQIIADRPTMQELRTRLRSLPSIVIDLSPAEKIRRERDSR